MLIVHPNNFLKTDQGENARTFELLKIFKQLGYSVDHLGFENFYISDDFVNHKQLNIKGLIDNLYLFDFKGNLNLINQLPVTKRITNRLLGVKQISQFSDWAIEGVKKEFDKAINANEYDVIILFYTYLANLLKDIKCKAKKVLSMEDCLFLQLFFWGGGNNPKSVTLGKMMDEELSRLKHFDEIICISHDEKLMYEKLTRRDINFVPHLQSNNVTKSSIALKDRKWDVMYVGAANPFNIEGMNWFVKEVYPYLSKDIRFVFVGSATGSLVAKYPNIETIHFAENLDEIYDNVKITICPMFMGTGMKIKVVESMARGLPVVCNDRGVDGFPDKTKSGCLVTQDAKEFAGYVNCLLSDEPFYYKTATDIALYYEELFDHEKYINLLSDMLG